MQGSACLIGSVSTHPFWPTRSVISRELSHSGFSSTCSLVDWRRNPRERGSLPSIAAALALLWNLGSLVGLATAPRGGDISDAIVAASFSVLSLLPAVLLHISLGPRRPVLWITGYVVSATCHRASHRRSGHRRASLSLRRACF